MEVGVEVGVGGVEEDVEGGVEGGTLGDFVSISGYEVQQHIMGFTQFSQPSVCVCVSEERHRQLPLHHRQLPLHHRQLPLHLPDLLAIANKTMCQLCLTMMCT